MTQSVIITVGSQTPLEEEIMNYTAEQIGQTSRKRGKEEEMQGLIRRLEVQTQ